MGGLCEEGHEFLRVCRKRNSDKTKHLIDVLVTQHAKWVAQRVRRALFGQSVSVFGTSSCQNDHEQKKSGPLTALTTPRAADAGKPQRNCGQMRRLKEAFSNSDETAVVVERVGHNGGIFPSPPA